MESKPTYISQYTDQRGKTMCEGRDTHNEQQRMHKTIEKRDIKIIKGGEGEEEDDFFFWNVFEPI